MFSQRTRLADMKLKTKIMAGFLLVASITLAMGMAGYRGMGEITVNTDEIVGNRLPSVQSLLILMEAQTAVLVGERGLIIRRMMEPAIRKAQYDFIDAACRETYERIRIGGSFATLRENLLFLGELRQRGGIEEFIISFVVNALNFREMKAFAGMGFELGCDQVAFSYMSNWLNLSDEEYLELAVHLPGHREHEALKEIIRAPIFSDPRVFLHNLGGLRPGRILGDSMFV